MNSDSFVRLFDKSVEDVDVAALPCQAVTSDGSGALKAVRVPSKEELKLWYQAFRPVLVAFSLLPLVPKKVSDLTTGFVVVADAFFSI